MRNVRIKQKGKLTAFERKAFEKRQSIMLSNDRPFKRCQFAAFVSFDIYVFERMRAASFEIVSTATVGGAECLSRAAVLL